MALTDFWIALPLLLPYHHHREPTACLTVHCDHAVSCLSVHNSTARSFHGPHYYRMTKCLLALHTSSPQPPGNLAEHLPY